jgi:hypothetical protein
MPVTKKRKPNRYNSKRKSKYISKNKRRTSKRNTRRKRKSKNRRLLKSRRQRGGSDAGKTTESTSTKFDYFLSDNKLFINQKYLSGDPSDDHIEDYLYFALLYSPKELDELFDGIVIVDDECKKVENPGLVKMITALKDRLINFGSIVEILMDKPIQGNVETLKTLFMDDEEIFGTDVVEQIISEYTKLIINPNTTQSLPEAMTAGRELSIAAPSALNQAVAAGADRSGGGYRFQSGGSSFLMGPLNRIRQIIAPRNSSVNSEPTAEPPADMSSRNIIDERGRLVAHAIGRVDNIGGQSCDSFKTADTCHPTRCLWDREGNKCKKKPPRTSPLLPQAEGGIKLYKPEEFQARFEELRDLRHKQSKKTFPRLPPAPEKSILKKRLVGFSSLMMGGQPKHNHFVNSPRVRFNLNTEGPDPTLETRGGRYLKPTNPALRARSADISSALDQNAEAIRAVLIAKLHREALRQIIKGDTQFVLATDARVYKSRTSISKYEVSFTRTEGGDQQVYAAVPSMSGMLFTEHLTEDEKPTFDQHFFPVYRGEAENYTRARTNSRRNNTDNIIILNIKDRRFKIYFPDNDNLSHLRHQTNNSHRVVKTPSFNFVLLPKQPHDKSQFFLNEVSVDAIEPYFNISIRHLVNLYIQLNLSLWNVTMENIWVVNEDQVKLIHDLVHVHKHSSTDEDIHLLNTEIGYELIRYFCMCTGVEYNLDLLLTLVYKPDAEINSYIDTQEELLRPWLQTLANLMSDENIVSFIVFVKSLGGFVLDCAATGRVGLDNRFLEVLNTEYSPLVVWLKHTYNYCVEYPVELSYLNLLLYLNNEGLTYGLALISRLFPKPILDSIPEPALLGTSTNNQHDIERRLDAMIRAALKKQPVPTPRPLKTFVKSGATPDAGAGEGGE